METNNNYTTNGRCIPGLELCGTTPLTHENDEAIHEEDGLNHYRNDHFQYRSYPHNID